MNPLIRKFASEDACPIEVVYHAAASIITSVGQFFVTCPDPTPYVQAGDLVLYSSFVRNGLQDTTGPNNGLPIGNTAYYASDTSTTSNYCELFARARLISGGESITADERKFSYFASFIGSEAVCTTLVVRGVKPGAWNAGLQVGQYISSEFGDAYTTQDGAVTLYSGNAPERSVVRANPKSLAIAQHFTITNGAVGPAPLGWEAGLEYRQDASPRRIRAFGEYRYFPDTGTTTTVARNPRPTQGNHATLLMHVFTE